MNKNFERELPEGYKQALYINAKDKKFGIIFNMIALAIMVIVMVIANLPLYINGELSWAIIRVGSRKLMISELILIVALLFKAVAVKIFVKIIWRVNY